MNPENPSHDRLRSSIRAVTAGVAAVASQWFLHVGTPSAPFAPYSIGNWVIRHAPGSLATTAIERLGGNALRVLGAIAILASVALAVLLRRLSPLLMATVAAGLTIVAALLDPLRPGARGTADSAAVAAVAVLVVRLVLEPAQAVPVVASQGSTRRHVLAGGGALLLGVVLGANAIRHATRRLGGALVRADRTARIPSDAEFASVAGISPPVTTPEDHYTVDINLEPPIIDASKWRLRISGAVDREVTVTLDQLRDMPTTERLAALSCISNPVGGRLVGNARWTGVPLADLLAAAQPHATATTLEARGADGYSETVPLDAALDRNALIAFGMDGALLPTNHGFPARLRIPGRYGVKNVKWLTELVVLEQPKLGYWARRGWDVDAVVRTESRIDTPRHGERAARLVTIAGIAWAGDRRIDRVEVSTDDGANWQPAQLETETDPLSWRRWKLDASLEPGTRPLIVRATDGRGHTQVGDRLPSHPSGASGWHRIVVDVQ